MNGLTLGRVFGTEVRAHWTWILDPGAASPCSSAYGPEQRHRRRCGRPSLAWGASIATAALVFVSVTAHELAHVVRGPAQRPCDRPSWSCSCSAAPIVMEVKPRTPGEEFRISLAGPVLSLVPWLWPSAFAAVLLLAGPFDIDRAPAGPPGGPVRGVDGWRSST